MKFKLFGLLVILFSFLIPNTTYAARTEWLNVLKDDFTDPYSVLVARTAPLYKGELWVVEYGIGCLSMWRYEDKFILATYSLFLDGVGGKLILPDTYSQGECKNWDAHKIDDVADDLRSEDWNWLVNKGYIDSPNDNYFNNYTGYNYNDLLYVDQKQKKSSQISCPARSTLSKEDGICYCDVGYIVDQTKTKCEKEMINVDYAKINKLTYVYETKSTKAKKLNKAYRGQKLEVLEKSKIWVKVKAGKYEGWVLLKDVTLKTERMWVKDKK